MTRNQRLARILVAAALPAVALLLCAVLSGADPVAPKYLELGKGPTLILVHDLGSNRMVWMPTARKLVGRYHVVLVDLPGHGESPLPDPFTTDAAAAALGQVLTKWSPDSTVVVGKGMGGTLALMALKGQPGKVRGVALIDAGLKSPMKVDDQMIKYVQEQLDENYDMVLRRVYTKLGRDSVQGAVIHATAAQVQAHTIKSYLGAALSGDANPALKALDAPYLLLVTDQPLRSNPRTQGLMLREMGYDDTLSVPVRRIHDAAYLVMQDQPDTLAAVLSDFATRVIAKKK